ncbi:helix-turn-helix transcriptional regulator [Nonomuraea sp. NEAU-A123]|uniref:helix-turn-helix domain-containing protein n=1 Tax=Nonomuraea sp. NEAU-A123 TaxID=2839649 RepID=UPI001BE4003C|nr:helix-turn-helix transcriptional regulator [Nonomuraea sp. NEAU-A123]MBT2229787.1 helix-turn-helix domain-containing protein [Nonomuraea sp. NEAU-A123]
MRDIARARLAMGQELKELRLDARLTGRQLAARFDWQASKISKIEGGKQTPSEDDIRAWCEATGRPEKAASLISSLRAMETLYGEWRRQLRLGTATRQKSWAEMEAETKHFRVFESVLIPGLLQTSEYARLRLSQVIAFHDIPNDLEDGLATRMRRQEILYARDKSFHFVILEAALRLGMAPSDIMLDQLERLIALSLMPRVRLGIVPLNAQLPFAPQHGFWIFDERAVHVETVAAELTLTLPEEVAQYVRLFDWFAKAAQYGHQARQIITKSMEARARDA